MSTGVRAGAAAAALITVAVVTVAVVTVAVVAVAVGAAGPGRADPNGQLYGDPGAAAGYWRYQHQEDCGLMAAADVVALNAETIWDYPPGRGQRAQADHAVVATGVDTRTDVVHLNDSGTPTGRDEQVPMATFAQAWSTGDNLLIVTRQTGE